MKKIVSLLLVFGAVSSVTGLGAYAEDKVLMACQFPFMGESKILSTVVVLQEEGVAEPKLIYTYVAPNYVGTGVENNVILSELDREKAKEDGMLGGLAAIAKVPQAKVYRLKSVRGQRSDDSNPAMIQLVDKKGKILGGIFTIGMAVVRCEKLM